MFRSKLEIQRYARNKNKHYTRWQTKRASPPAKKVKRKTERAAERKRARGQKMAIKFE